MPYLWSYDTLRDLIMTSAHAISTDEAERRVLVLENPGLLGRHLVTDSLYAGLQLIMPGEFARSHRHTAAALRFIIEGERTYTAVAGERAYMEPGDFIVTPSWAWHEHRNEGGGPTVWLDVLDVPLVRFLGAGFSEHYSSAEFPRSAPPGDSRHRYGSNLLPVGFKRGAGASPVFSYPYARARETLEHLKRQTEWDACHGLKMEYIDPTTGGPAIPTISTFLQLVPRAFATAPYATTASAVYCVVAGSGTRDDRRRPLGARVSLSASRSLGGTELAAARDPGRRGIGAVQRLRRGGPTQAESLARAARLNDASAAGDPPAARPVATENDTICANRSRLREDNGKFVSVSERSRPRSEPGPARSGLTPDAATTRSLPAPP